jgi:hypothetical protein
VVAEIFGLHAPTNNTKIGTASVGAILPTSFSPTTYPDKHVENVELKPIEGSQSFPMTCSKGGSVKVKVIAQDSRNVSSSAESSVQLKPCGKGR